MESDEAAPLVKLMARCTTSPERCFFATWDGYGDGDSTGRPLAFRRSPRLGPISIDGVLRRYRRSRPEWRRPRLSRLAGPRGRARGVLVTSPALRARSPATM